MIEGPYLTSALIPDERGKPMTGNEKRDEIFSEVRDLSRQRADVESSTLSPEMKKSCDDRLRIRIEKLVAVLESPAPNSPAITPPPKTE
jgi:hypothetical protein